MCVLCVGTSTICQHCFGNNRGVEAGSIIQAIITDEVAGVVLM